MKTIDRLFPRKPQGSDWTIMFIGCAMISYWLIGHYINVYQFAVMGALFEILWLPFIILILLMPILSLSQFIKHRKNLAFTDGISLLLSILILIAFLVD